MPENVTTHKSDKEYLSGIVERVTYHNEENGFCVLRVKVLKKKDLVTVVGRVTVVSPEEYIQAGGGWCNDKDHGLQFKAAFLKAMPPNTLEWIKKYLGSGLIKGIGPHFAKQLIAAFKEEVFDVIENHPELLTTVAGIGKVRAATITNNWKDQKVIRYIMVFLQSHGVSTTKATRIYKTYGERSIEIVSENPYKLAEDIHGIEFIYRPNTTTLTTSLNVENNSCLHRNIVYTKWNASYCGSLSKMHWLAFIDTFRLKLSDAENSFWLTLADAENISARII